AKKNQNDRPSLSILLLVFSVSSVVKNLMNTKSQKELAFLQDLYVATDWSERFARLVDKHLTLPEEGRALYIAAGTGGHAIALQATDVFQLRRVFFHLLGSAAKLRSGRSRHRCRNPHHPFANGFGYRECGRPIRAGRRHFLDGD